MIEKQLIMKRVPWLEEPRLYGLFKESSEVYGITNRELIFTGSLELCREKTIELNETKVCGEWYRIYEFCFDT